MSSLGLAPLGALEIDVAPPATKRRLIVAFALGCARPARHATGTIRASAARTTTRCAKTSSRWRRPACGARDRRRSCRSSAGPLIELVRTTETTSLPGTTTDRGARLGLEGVGGVDVRLGAGILIVEVRLARAGLAHLQSGDANASAATLGVGYRILF